MPTLVLREYDSSIPGDPVWKNPVPDLIAGLGNREVPAVGGGIVAREQP